uniref:Uncharacterized protein n=1 Tax=Pipistrellus kuhlii TaxID=59472 RepID=A0A7J7TP61_PIPKU|nr:hypothetical protein mPipKuh1_009321 [Pipistrellus kuhlii]
MGTKHCLGGEMPKPQEKGLYSQWARGGGSETEAGSTCLPVFMETLGKYAQLLSRKVLPFSAGTRRLYSVFLPARSVSVLLGLCQTERRKRCFLIIVTICVSYYLERGRASHTSAFKHPVPPRPSGSEQRTEGNNNSETKVSISPERSQE